MGVVYQAWDEVLNVVVALKIIRPDTISNPAAAREIERRFKRELLLARKVTHKHVVRIHDLGDVNGTKYITMSFVEGEDLVATLKREGKLPIPRVVHLARQVASGLEAAHDAGVVHRDLKPANIMVDTEDDALIMDFGIALSAGDPRARMAAIAASKDSAETMLARRRSNGRGQQHRPGRHHRHARLHVPRAVERRHRRSSLRHLHLWADPDRPAARAPQRCRPARPRGRR